MKANPINTMNRIFQALIIIAGCMPFSFLKAEDSPGNSDSLKSFAAVVKEDFSRWDSNGDGQLSEDEIVAALNNPKIKNESAAAMVAIDKVIRHHKYNLPPLTKDYLISSPLKEASKSKEHADSADDGSKTEKYEFPPAFQPRYRDALNKLRVTSQELFPQSLPAFTATHQGTLGDCPFVSTVGALVYRNPADIKSMVKQNKDRTFTVMFGNGQTIKIAHLTDSDIAMWSSAGTNGLWLTVLEKAYRRIQAQSLKKANVYEGFGSGLTVEIFTGHEVQNISFKEYTPDSPKFASLRKKIEKAVSEQLLMKTGTGGKKLPPGVPHGHAFAVLGYDKNTDLVQVWNPWRNNFAPGGPDGLKNGYKTKAGQFFVPLKEFVEIFNNINIETKTPYRD